MLYPSPSANDHTRACIRSPVQWVPRAPYDVICPEEVHHGLVESTQWASAGWRFVREKELTPKHVSKKSLFWPAKPSDALWRLTATISCRGIEYWDKLGSLLHSLPLRNMLTVSGKLSMWSTPMPQPAATPTRGSSHLFWGHIA